MKKCRIGGLAVMFNGDLARKYGCTTSGSRPCHHAGLDVCSRNGALKSVAFNI